MSITNVNELWGRKWRFKDNTPSPSEFSLRNSVTGVKFATFYLGEEVKDVYQSGSSVGNVGITTQGTFIRIGVSASSFTYAYAASGWVGKPAILEFIENTENYTLSCTNESNFISWFNENATEYVPPLSEWTKGVADAIREKKGTSDLIKPLDFAKEIINIKSSGGSVDTSDATATLNDILLGKTAYVDGKKIEGTIETWNGETNSDVNVENVVSVNGLIEEYKVYAGENINAGDFIDFVTNVFKQLSSTSNSNNNNAPSCVLLEPNKVFIAHSYSSSMYLYGTIVEINGTEMTATTTKLNSTSYSAITSSSCVLVEPNKVFIAHAYGNGSSYLYGTIVNVDGTAMTATTTQLDANTYSGYGQSCVLLEPNKVFIAHRYSSSKYLYGTIVEINGTEMTATSKKLHTSSNGCYYNPSCILLESNKVFIAHAFSNEYLYGTIVTIDGTNMTTTHKNLNSKSNACSFYGPSCVLLEPNKVFIGVTYTNVSYLAGVIVEINGTEMTSTTKQFYTEDHVSYRYEVKCCLLDSNKVIMLHRYSQKELFALTLVKIDGTNMIAETTILDSGNKMNYPVCAFLESNKVFIVNASGGYSYLAAYIYFGNQAKQPTETTLGKTIKGIAKTSGTGGETIQVFVPNTGV